MRTVNTSCCFPADAAVARFAGRHGGGWASSDSSREYVETYAVVLLEPRYACRLQSLTHPSPWPAHACWLFSFCSCRDTIRVPAALPGRPTAGYYRCSWYYGRTDRHCTCKAEQGWKVSQGYLPRAATCATGGDDNVACASAIRCPTMRAAHTQVNR